jgi:hypothetical protein
LEIFIGRPRRMCADEIWTRIEMKELNSNRKDDDIGKNI